MSVGNRFIKHAEYQELFHSVWVSLLRILPNKLVNIDFIVVCLISIRLIKYFRCSIKLSLRTMIL